jgi:hypothetical protein
LRISREETPSAPDDAEHGTARKSLSDAKRHFGDELRHSSACRAYLFGVPFPPARLGVPGDRHGLRAGGRGGSGGGASMCGAKMPDCVHQTISVAARMTSAMAARHPAAPIHHA